MLQAAAYRQPLPHRRNPRRDRPEEGDMTPAPHPEHVVDNSMEWLALLDDCMALIDLERWLAPLSRYLTDLN
jgi:hypothetical protein